MNQFSTTFSIAAAVNDDLVLKHNLLSSPDLVRGQISLRTYKGQPCAGLAYNTALEEASSDLIAFLHQDVYLPSGWSERVLYIAHKLDQMDPDWAVLGIFGKSESADHVGRVWSTGLGKELNHACSEPVRTISVDELAIILKVSSGLTFDPNLPSFHLFGTDIVQTARSRGLGAYVADLPVIHNSRPVTSLGGGYARAYRHMQKKWHDRLPLDTLVVPIRASTMTLWKAQARFMWKRRFRNDRGSASELNPAEIARSLGYE